MAKLTTRSTASGVTTEDFIHIVITGDTTQDPSGSSYKASIEQVFDALSGYCITDLYVSNIHSCSPLNINPLDEGNVYFGSTSGITLDVINSRIGIGIDNPQYDLHIIGSDSLLYYDSTVLGGRLKLSGDTNLPRMEVSIGSYLTKPATGGSMGVRTWDDTLASGYGKVGDMHLYAGDEINGLNIINNGPGTNTEDYIRFYAGQGATTSNTADIHIQGSGLTRGYVGIGTETPDELLHVDGKVKTTNFQMTSGAANGYILTSDNSGNASWQPSSGGTGPFTGGSTNCITDFYVTNIHGCSPITIMNETQFSGCSATINSNSFAQGFTTKAYAKFSNVSGNQSRAGTNKAYSATSVVNGVVTLASTYGNVTGNTEFTIGEFIYLNDAEYDNTLSANIFVIINTSYNGTSTLITLNDNSQNTNSLTVLGTSVAANSQGGDIISEGMYSSSRGSTTSVGYSSHSEGFRSESFGTYSHAEGYTKSLGFGSHSEGFSTKSVGQYSHSEGYFTNTYGDFSHAEGESTSTGTKSAFFASAVTSGVIYFDSGYGDQTSLFNPGDYLFLDDTQFGNVYQTNSYSISAVTYSFTTIIYLDDTSITTGLGAYVGYTGGDKLAGGLGAKSSGKGSTAFGNHSNTSGESCRAWSNNSMARGKGASAFGSGSFSNGFMTSTYGDYSYAEGNSSVARGIYSHAEGSSTQANGNSSHAEGTNSVASGSYSHAEGSSTASGIFSHAEGDGTTASGQYSHSQNKASIASGDNSHAGGVGSTSYGIVSFAHGDNCDAYGPLSVSLGGMNNFVNSGDTDGSAILGGYENEINYLSPTDEVRHSAIIGGSGNTVNSFRSAIIGGENNTLTGSYSVILGGANITGTGNETVYVPNIVLAYSGTPTSSADTIGEPGSLLWDDTYLYYKDNVGWKRISGSTF